MQTADCETGRFAGQAVHCCSIVDGYLYSQHAHIQQVVLMQAMAELSDIAWRKVCESKRNCQIRKSMGCNTNTTEQCAAIVGVKYIMYSTNIIGTVCSVINKVVYLGMLPRAISDRVVLHFLFNQDDQFTKAQELWPIKARKGWNFPLDWEYCKFQVEKPGVMHKLFLIKAANEKVFSPAGNVVALKLLHRLHGLQEFDPIEFMRKLATASLGLL